MYRIESGKIKNVDELVNISESWENQMEISGHFLDRKYFITSILEGDLPPVERASLENYELNEVYFQDELIGFFDLYYGYPKKDHAWISIFVIDKDKRSNNHGQEILKLIENRVTKRNFFILGIGVDLKNHGGLMFWTKQGFTDVIGVFGDKTYGMDKFATICLRKYLNNKI